MTKESYVNIQNQIVKTPLRLRLFWVIAVVFPKLLAAVYLLSIIIVFFKMPDRVVKLIVIPMLCYFFVSIFRNFVNRKRPCDALGYTSLIEIKPDKGKSFPSRHCASAFVIAFCMFWIYPAAGIFLCVLAIGIAISRVCGGVHYPLDVIAGCVVGFVFSFVGNAYF